MTTLMKTQRRVVNQEGTSMTVIFPDENISPKFFDSALENHLFVRTIFYTLQGEGPLAGRPAVFLRLGGCNLGAKGVQAAGCEWCDTDFRIRESKWMHFDQILTEAKACIKASGGTFPKNPLIVITGGEPMLQKNVADFIEQAEGWDFQIETNGLYYFELPFRTVIVVSPKLGGSKHYPPLRSEWHTHADCLKFVVEDNPESPYHHAPNYAFDFPGPVYISPIAYYKRAMTEVEGERASIWNRDLIDITATARNYRYAAEYALKYDFRLSLQTHLFVSMP